MNKDDILRIVYEQVTSLAWNTYKIYDVRISGFCLFLLCFCFSPRVYLLYHTWGQVIYGGVAGSTFGIIWFFFTQEVLTPIFPKIAAWYVVLSFLSSVTGEDDLISVSLTGWTSLHNV